MTTDIRRTFVESVVAQLDGMTLDEETRHLALSMAIYVAEGWVKLASEGHDIERLVETQTQRVVASICSMVSMAHALRTAQMDEWLAETVGT